MTLKYLISLNLIFIRSINWPNISTLIQKLDRRLLTRVQAQSVLILFVYFFFKDNKAHNIHEKEVQFNDSMSLNRDQDRV